MTFEEWWKQNYNSPVSMSSGMAEQAWQAATKAERERCAGIAEHRGAESNAIQYSHDQCETASYDTAQKIAVAIREEKG